MKNEKVKQLVVMAMLAALAYVLMVLIRIPVVSFLKYEPKDVIITIYRTGQSLNTYIGCTAIPRKADNRHVSYSLSPVSCCNTCHH